MHAASTNHTRRRFLRQVAGAAALAAMPEAAWAQDYPSRPVRWVLGYTVGARPTSCPAS